MGEVEGGKEMGMDLPDQWKTASYAPAYGNVRKYKFIIVV